MRSHTENYQKDMQKKLSEYSSFSKRHLSKDFKRVGVAYPPKQIALLVFKQSRKVQLYAKKGNRWYFIKTFPVLAASGGPGPKLHQGDKQVPEGVYRITELNPDSHFLMSMKLNYPNSFDKEHALEAHRSNLGGNIFIHGKARSIGCIAIGDEGIKELFPLVAMVGLEHVEVIIAPDDLRYKRAIYGYIHPDWLTQLYKRIRISLLHFPLPRHI